MSDNVKHPSHYCKGGIECIDAIKAAVSDITDPFEAYCTGNIIKYIWRWNDKGGVEDLNKAKQYADFITDYRENKENPVTDKPVGKYDEMDNKKLFYLIHEGAASCGPSTCPLFAPTDGPIGPSCGEWVEEHPDEFRRIAIEYLEGKE